MLTHKIQHNIGSVDKQKKNERALAYVFKCVVIAVKVN